MNLLDFLGVWINSIWGKKDSGVHFEVVSTFSASGDAMSGDWRRGSEAGDSTYFEEKKIGQTREKGLYQIMTNIDNGTQKHISSIR